MCSGIDQSLQLFLPPPLFFLLSDQQGAMAPLRPLSYDSAYTMSKKTGFTLYKFLKFVVKDRAGNVTCKSIYKRTFNSLS